MELQFQWPPTPSPNSLIIATNSLLQTPILSPPPVSDSEHSDISESATAYLTIDEIQRRWLEALEYYRSGFVSTSAQRYSRLLIKLNEHIESVTSKDPATQLAITYASLTSHLPHISTIPLIAAKLWFNIGIIKGFLGEYWFAEEAFEQSVKHDSGLVIAWYAMGVTRCEQARWREGVRAFERASELTWGDGEGIDGGEINFVRAVIPGTTEAGGNGPEAMAQNARKSKTPLTIMTSLKQTIESLTSPTTPTNKSTNLNSSDYTPSKKWRLPKSFIEANRRAALFEKLWKKDRIPKPEDGISNIHGIPVGVMFAPDENLGLPESFGPFPNPAFCKDSNGSTCLKRSLTQVPVRGLGRGLTHHEPTEYGVRSEAEAVAKSDNRQKVVLPVRSSSLSTASTHKPLPRRPRPNVLDLPAKHPLPPPSPSSACPDPLVIRKRGVAKLKLGTDRRNAARNAAPALTNAQSPSATSGEPVLTISADWNEHKPDTVAQNKAHVPVQYAPEERKGGTLCRNASVLAAATAISEGLTVKHLGEVPDLLHKGPDYGILRDIAQLSPPTTYSPGSSYSPLDILANLTLLIPSPPGSPLPSSPIEGISSPTHSHPIPSANLSPPTRTAPLPKLCTPSSPSFAPNHQTESQKQHKNHQAVKEETISTTAAATKPRAFTNPNPDIHPYASAYAAPFPYRLPHINGTNEEKNPTSNHNNGAKTAKQHSNTPCPKRSAIKPITSSTKPTTSASGSSGWSDDLHFITEMTSLSGSTPPSATNPSPNTSSALGHTPSTSGRKSHRHTKTKKAKKLLSPIERLQKLDEAFEAAKPCYQSSPSVYSTLGLEASSHGSEPYAPLAVIKAYECGSPGLSSTRASSSVVGWKGKGKLVEIGAGGKTSRVPSSVYSRSTGGKASEGIGASSSVYSRSTGGKVGEMGSGVSSSVYSRSTGGKGVGDKSGWALSVYCPETGLELLQPTVYRRVSQVGGTCT